MQDKDWNCGVSSEHGAGQPLLSMRLFCLSIGTAMPAPLPSTSSAAADIARIKNIAQQRPGNHPLRFRIKPRAVTSSSSRRVPPGASTAALTSEPPSPIAKRRRRANPHRSERHLATSRAASRTLRIREPASFASAGEGRVQVAPTQRRLLRSTAIKLR